MFAMIASISSRRLLVASALVLAPACSPPQKPEAPPGSVAVDLKNRPKGGAVFYESNEVPAGAGRDDAGSGNSGAAWSSAKQRPATRAECEEITDIALRLKLKENGITDRAAFDAVRDEVRQSLGERMSSGCVGQSISEEALKCVRGTSTTSGLEECLR